MLFRSSAVRSTAQLQATPSRSAIQSSGEDVVPRPGEGEDWDRLSFVEPQTDETHRMAKGKEKAKLGKKGKLDAVEDDTPAKRRKGTRG